MLCDEPIIKKSFLKLYDKCLKLVLKDGIYAPSKFNLMANCMLLAIINLYPFFLQ